MYESNTPEAYCPQDFVLHGGAGANLSVQDVSQCLEVALQCLTTLRAGNTATLTT